MVRDEPAKQRLKMATAIVYLLGFSCGEWEAPETLQNATQLTRFPRLYKSAGREEVGHFCCEFVQRA